MLMTEMPPDFFASGLGNFIFYWHFGIGVLSCDQFAVSIELTEKQLSSICFNTCLLACGRSLVLTLLGWCPTVFIG